MSNLRKIRRMIASLNKPKKSEIRITLSDVILSIGIALLFIGIITGGYSYLYYIGGRPEQIVNSQVDGTYHLNAQPLGNPARKDIAIFCAIMASVGLILLVSALLAKLVIKNSEKELNP
jgi:hypothetical protein